MKRSDEARPQQDRRSAVGRWINRQKWLVSHRLVWPVSYAIAKRLYFSPLFFMADGTETRWPGPWRIRAGFQETFWTIICGHGPLHALRMGGIYWGFTKIRTNKEAKP